MTWSALTTASSASGSTSATSVAVSPTALAVSRATGSRISRSAPSSGRAARTISPYRAAVQTQIRSAGRTARSRSKASASRLCAPPSARVRTSSSCLGRPARDSGHSRVPEPPAMITAWRTSASSRRVSTMGPRCAGPAPPRTAADAGQLVGRALRLRPLAHPGAHVGDEHPATEPRAESQPQGRVQRARVAAHQVAQRAGVVHPLHAVRVAAGGVTALVLDDGRRRVDVQPPALAEPGGQVDVLEVHEVAGVETAHGVEGLEVDQEAGARQPAGGALARRL